jgi:hypothetical protein
VTKKTVAALLERELRALQREIAAYPSDAHVWQVPPGLPNSGGTLALHAAGNLMHFVGAVLGGTGYVRDRDAEFARRNVSARELSHMLADAEATVRRVLDALPDESFETPYPVPVAGRRINTGEFLGHLATHLAYHLGQVDYHRRVVTGDATGVGAVSPVELPSAVPVESSG